MRAVVNPAFAALRSQVGPLAWVQLDNINSTRAAQLDTLSGFPDYVANGFVLTVNQPDKVTAKLSALAAAEAKRTKAA